MTNPGIPSRNRMTPHRSRGSPPLGHLSTGIRAQFLRATMALAHAARGPRKSPLRPPVYDDPCQAEGLLHARPPGVLVDKAALPRQGIRLDQGHGRLTELADAALRQGAPLGV